MSRVTLDLGRLFEPVGDGTRITRAEAHEQLVELRAEITRIRITQGFDEEHAPDRATTREFAALDQLLSTVGKLINLLDRHVEPRP